MIDGPADALTAIALAAAVVLTGFIAISPALALFIVARHSGIPLLPSIIVGIGGYAFALIHVYLTRYQ